MSLNLTTKQNNMLKKLIDCIDIQIKDNSVLLSFKNDLLIYTKGNQLIFSEKQTVIKSNKIHLNPETKIKDNIKNCNPDDIIKNITIDDLKKLKNVKKEFLTL